MKHQSDSGIEEAILEQRLAEQDIFRQVLHDVRKKYRRLLFWTAAAAGGLSIMWIFFGCPILHQVKLCLGASGCQL